MGKVAWPFWTMSAQVNTIMPRYVHEHSLEVEPITDLMGSKITCVGLGNAYTRPLDYVVIQVRVDRVQGYDEDQIALVIPDFSKFAARVPVILRMLTIDQVVNVMREVEMDALLMPWADARAAHLLSVHRMMTIRVGNGQEEKEVVALPVPEPPKGKILEEKAGKSHNSPTPVLTVRQRHDKLFDELDLSGLDSWTLELADTAHQLLAKYHDMCLLDLAGLCCTHSTEHIIKVTDDTPFKEQFR